MSQSLQQMCNWDRAAINAEAHTHAACFPSARVGSDLTTPVKVRDAKGVHVEPMSLGKRSSPWKHFSGRPRQYLGVENLLHKPQGFVQGVFGIDWTLIISHSLSADAAPCCGSGSHCGSDTVLPRVPAVRRVR